MEMRPFNIGDAVWTYELDLVAFSVPLPGTVTAMSHTGVHTESRVIPFGRAFHSRADAVEQARKRVTNLLEIIK